MKRQGQLWEAGSKHPSNQPGTNVNLVLMTWSNDYFKPEMTMSNGYYATTPEEHAVMVTTYHTNPHTW